MSNFIVVSKFSSIYAFSLDRNERYDFEKFSKRFLIRGIMQLFRETVPLFFLGKIFKVLTLASLSSRKTKLKITSRTRAVAILRACDIKKKKKMSKILTSSFSITEDPRMEL